MSSRTLQTRLNALGYGRLRFGVSAHATGPTSPSFFAFFLTQKDAAFAAQARLHSEDGHSFRVMEAPGPEEVRHPLFIAIPHIV
jgi:hypothetical protein